MTATTPKGQINAPDQLDCMSTLRTDNSQTLIAGMRSELTEKQQYIIQLEAHIGLLGSEIERLKEVINLQVENYAELKEQQEAQHGYFNSVMVENDQAKKADAEIECLRKANLDCVAHYDDARAECERHIQEVDASREAIDRKDAALRMALDAIEGTYIGWRGEKSGEAITTIKEALS